MTGFRCERASGRLGRESLYRPQKQTLRFVRLRWAWHGQRSRRRLTESQLAAYLGRFQTWRHRAESPARFQRTGPSGPDRADNQLRGNLKSQAIRIEYEIEVVRIVGIGT